MYIMDPYDSALEEILSKGVVKRNRTGVEAKTIFGMQRRYSINERFPILTRRKVWPKSVFAELLWFLSGSTRNSDLQALGSNIWTPWVDPKWASQKGYAYEDVLGPLYGFQLRHFDGDYNDGLLLPNPLPYGYGGTDQLANMVKLLQTDPDSRRNLFVLWNPSQLSEMRLPPCHYSFQVYVEDGKLSGHLVQRSADFPVGIPANIQFYSALIHMLAQQCGYEPDEFVHTTSDSHIYVDQIPAVEEYLARPKPDSPVLKLNKAEDIYSYKLTDFEVQSYDPQPAIKLPVAV